MDTLGTLANSEDPDEMQQHYAAGSVLFGRIKTFLRNLMHLLESLI